MSLEQRVCEPQQTEQPTTEGAELVDQPKGLERVWTVQSAHQAFGSRPLKPVEVAVLKEVNEVTFGNGERPERHERRRLARKFQVW